MAKGAKLSSWPLTGTVQLTEEEINSQSKALRASSFMLCALYSWMALIETKEELRKYCYQ